MDFPIQVIDIHARLQAELPSHAPALAHVAQEFRARQSDCMQCAHWRVQVFPLATTPPTVEIAELGCALGLNDDSWPNGAIFHYCSSRLDPAAAADWSSVPGVPAAHAAEAERQRQQQQQPPEAQRPNPWVPRG